MRFCRTLAAAALVLVWSSRAVAEEPRALRYDTRVDVGVTAMGATWYLMSELLKASLVPEKCRWCYRADDGGDPDLERDDDSGDLDERNDDRRLSGVEAAAEGRGHGDRVQDRAPVAEPEGRLLRVRPREQGQDRARPRGQGPRRE